MSRLTSAIRTILSTGIYFFSVEDRVNWGIIIIIYYNSFYYCTAGHKPFLRSEILLYWPEVLVQGVFFYMAPANVTLLYLLESTKACSLPWVRMSYYRNCRSRITSISGTKGKPRVILVGFGKPSWVTAQEGSHVLKKDSLPYSALRMMHILNVAIRNEVIKMC